MPKIDENQAQKILNLIKSIENGTNSETKSFQELYDTGSKQDQWIAKYAQETQGQIRSIEGVTEANKAARDSAIAHNNALKQQTLGAKATTVAMKALSIAGNMLAMWAITKGIELATKAIDNYVRRVEIAREKLEETTSEIESLQSELDGVGKKIDEILAKDEISLTDENTLKELQAENNELERRLKLLEAQKELESNDLNRKIESKYAKEWGNGRRGITPLNLTDAEKERYNDEINIDVSAGYAIQTVSRDIYAQIQIERAKELLALNRDLTDEEKAQYEEIKKYAITEGQALADLTDGYVAITDTEKEQKKIWEGLIEDFSVISSSTPGIAISIDDRLKAKFAMGKEDSQAISDWINSLSEDEKKIVITCEIDEASLDDLQEYLESKIEYIEDNISIEFDLATYEEQIDKIQSSIKTLRDALSSLNTDSLTENTVLDLLQEFPELISYVDMTADGFGNLAAGLNELINAQPTELINSLYELKDAIDTEEERQQIDALINSLQSLSTYGDSGIEAYATAIGATWQNTADVIEGVTTQFENLAKVQEAVANGLTISATAAAELAQMYPEILTNAEVTANGQITLNEEVVKSILAGRDATIEAQITQLEADKAVLTAKKEFAEAQLNMVKQVGEAEGNISLETAQYRINVANEVLKQAIEADEDEAEAYAEAIRVMSMNTEEFNVYVADVSTDMATNISNASAEMANSVAKNTTNMQKSFGALQSKVADVAKSIRAALNGEDVAVSDKIYAASGGQSGNSITTNATRADLNTYDFEWNPKDLSLDAFTSQLELDIQGYQDAISNIDTQIEILKNLQQTFYDTANSANGGIGSHNYADKIKELEAEKDKINNALKDNTSSGSTDTYDELFDFFERRIDVLNDALNLLSANLDNVVGAFAKNNLIDAQRELYAEEYKNYTDALAMYQQKANEALSKLPTDIAEKIKNGAVNITEFIGSGNEAVVDAIKDYEKWAEKVADCSQELAELKTTLRKLELEKFNNIISDFTDQFDLRDKSIGLIDKQMALLEEAGELIGESFFTAQKEQAQKQLEILKQEQAQLAGQLSSALASGYVEQGTNEWLEMVNALSDVEGSILDCQKAIEEFDNAILDLNWQVFDRIQKTFSNFSSELSNLAGLLDDIDIVDDTTGDWTKEAITRLGLYAQQYELARYQVDQYSKAMDDLKKDYLEGKYSTTEYADKLAELSEAQWDAVKTAESMKDAIVELNKARVDAITEGIEKEIDAYKELTNSQIDALKAEKDLHDYEKSIAEKTRSITELERQIAAMQNDNTAATVAKRKQLEQQLAEAKADLEETMYQHSIEVSQDALNKQYEDYKDVREAEIKALQESLNNEEEIISQSFENVRDNASLIADEITSIAQEHGVYVSEALITSWQSGVDAIANYGQALSNATSSFIANITRVEQEAWNLQKQADATADTFASLFSTRADNLVNQLTTSYYSEANLASMTQYLRDSLVNTLGGSYNASNILNSLNSITSAANTAANAVNSLNAASGNAGSGSAPSSGGSGGNGKPQVGDAVIFASGQYYNSSDGISPTGSQMLGQTVYITKINNASWANKPYHISRDKAGTQPLGWVTLDQLKGYKSGVRQLPNDEIAITQEDGTEIILSPVRGGMLLPKEAFYNKEGEPTILKKGDTVLTSKQTDNMFEWAQFNPEEFRKTLNIIPQNIMPDIPKVEPRPVNNTIQIDNVLTVQGSIDSGNVKRMELVAQRAINDAFGRFTNEVNH